MDTLTRPSQSDLCIARVMMQLRPHVTKKQYNYISVSYVYCTRSIQ